MTMGAGGAISAAFYFLVSLLTEYIQRSLYCHVEIDSMDPTHKWVL
jgi:hypothetical protein